MNARIIRKYKPQGEPGFMGQGHVAKAVIQVPYPESDPFILLMDDYLDKKDSTPAGGPHPHAGFETVTLMLEGEIGVGSHRMRAGDFQMMTAGSGIIHTETIDSITRMRLLQLWLVLPKQKRWTEPRVQDMKAASAPVVKKEGTEIKVYSGTLEGISSPVKNHTPVIIADVQIEPGSTAEIAIPPGFNSFLYLIEGDILINDDLVSTGEVAWLTKQPDESKLLATAGVTSARFILYSGLPQGDAIVSYGPFIADTQDDIRRLYHEYNKGTMQHISSVSQDQVFAW